MLTQTSIPGALRLTALATLLFPLTLAAQQPVPEQPAQEPVPIDPTTITFTEEEMKILSHALGYDVGRSVEGSMQQMRVDLKDFDLTEVIDGVRAGLSGDVPKYLQSQMAPIMQRFFERQQALVAILRKEEEEAAQLEWSAVAAKNLEEANAFLKKNKFKKGIKETESGLQYEIVRKGRGKRPDPKNWVKVHYRGSTLDGTEFDSSYVRAEPAVFPLDGVIPGWAEGLMLMKKGSQARLFVPPHLAYGEGGPAGGPLPFGPNSLLVFEVELLDFAEDQEELVPPESEAAETG